MPIAIPVTIGTQLHLQWGGSRSGGKKLGDPRLSRVEILTRTCKRTGGRPTGTVLATFYIPLGGTKACTRSTDADTRSKNYGSSVRSFITHSAGILRKVFND